MQFIAMSRRSVEDQLVDPNSYRNRAVLVGGAILIWVAGLLWMSQSKQLSTDSRTDTVLHASAIDVQDTAGSEAGDEVTELVIKSPRRSRAVANSTALAGPVEQPTYPVWFESERGLGVCKITWDGGSKVANLHVGVRLNEGPLAFSYACGKHSGRASIEVKPNRVNGVLFCEGSDGVRVETVRRKDSRCRKRTK